MTYQSPVQKRPYRIVDAVCEQLDIPFGTHATMVWDKSAAGADDGGNLVTVETDVGQLQVRRQDMVFDPVGGA